MNNDNNISIHLQDFPDLGFINSDTKLEEDMDLVRVICSTVLAIRDLMNLRVRLPLQSLTIIGKNAKRIQLYSDIIADEVNIKSINSDENISQFGDLKLKINFKKVGAKFGAKMKDIISHANNNNYKIHTSGEGRQPQCFVDLHQRQLDRATMELANKVRQTIVNIFDDVTRPIEFGSMTARKGDILP